MDVIKHNMKQERFQARFKQREINEDKSTLQNCRRYLKNMTEREERRGERERERENECLCTRARKVIKKFIVEGNKN